LVLIMETRLTVTGFIVDYSEVLIFEDDTIIIVIWRLQVCELEKILNVIIFDEFW
jgi:hypothetical protein